jgi:S1-C subfamily serine protease
MGEMTLRRLLEIGLTTGAIVAVMLWVVPRAIAIPSRALSSLLPLPIEKIQSIGEQITVKIIGTESEGTGIILQKQQQTYTVITSAHVLRPGTYNIQTLDGKTYPTNITYNARLQSGTNARDIAILQFNSNQNYEVAKIGSTIDLEISDRIYAMGFPFDSQNVDRRGWSFRVGQVLMKSDQSIEGGYQLAYSNKTEKGMSGGAILNTFGQLVALHGQGPALLDITFLYDGGQRPCAPMQKFISDSSWGIPVETIAKLLPTIVSPIVSSKVQSSAAPLTGLDLTPSQPEPSLDNLVFIQQAEAARQCRSFQETHLPPIAFPHIPVPPR